MHSSHLKRRSQTAANLMWEVQKLVSTDDWLNTPERAFTLLRRLDEELRELRRDVVDELHADGATWDEIGVAMGTSRQYAWQTYSH